MGVPSDESVEFQQGVINRLRRMHRKGLLLTRVQRAVLVLADFGATYHEEGFLAWVNNSRHVQLFFALPDALALAGLRECAAIVHRMGAHVPADMLDMRDDEFCRRWRETWSNAEHNELIALIEEFEQRDENISAAADALYQAHKGVMPEPYFPQIRLVRFTNPTTGVPIIRRVELDPEED